MAKVLTLKFGKKERQALDRAAHLRMAFLVNGLRAACREFDLETVIAVWQQENQETSSPEN